MKHKRSVVSLLTASTFLVLAVSGVLAFVLPFSITIVGLHALMGFVFVALIALHITNNSSHLSRYVKSKAVWATLGVTAILTVLFSWQPAPVRSVLGLSKNIGPALDRFEMTGNQLVYEYAPAPSYKMALTARTGKSFQADKLPHVAIWLENASFYHIKTLREPDDLDAGRKALPYWDFKMRGWEEAKRKAEEEPVDAVSEPTQNSSFDPADYIVPPDSDTPMPYRLLIEINNPVDEQPSLVYAVEIDNADPRTFQLLELVGYPKQEEPDEPGKETWALYYVDAHTEAMELIDSALLTIERE